MGATPPHLFGVRVCRLMCVYVSGLFVYLCELYVKTQAVSEGGLFFFFPPVGSVKRVVYLASGATCSSDWVASNLFRWIFLSVIRPHEESPQPHLGFLERSSSEFES